MDNYRYGFLMALVIFTGFLVIGVNNKVDEYHDTQKHQLSIIGAELKTIIDPVQVQCTDDPQQDYKILADAVEKVRTHPYKIIEVDKSPSCAWDGIHSLIDLSGGINTIGLQNIDESKINCGDNCPPMIKLR